MRLCLLILILSSTLAQAYPQIRPGDYNTLNLQAGSEVLYEVQVRAANACRDDWGETWQQQACRDKVGYMSAYFAHNGDSSFCKSWNELKKIKLGTIDDLLESTDDYHAGITLRYIKEKVGASTVWLMPIFPNNDRWSIPDEGKGDCDNMGSPYAVRDNLHVSGRLDRFCVKAGVDEYSAEEKGNQVCWGNFALDQLISKAHEMGMKVMLDVAINHFGHNYLFYDYGSHRPVRERLVAKQSLDDLWNFSSTYDVANLRPELVDSEQKLLDRAKTDGLTANAIAEIQGKCPAITGDRLVRAAGMWRDMLDWERKQFKCELPLYLEAVAPGFYLGQKDRGEPQPSWGLGSNFTNNWTDVKFLYHHEYHSDRGDGRGDFYNVFVRNREYNFRIVNYWVSRGVDGFRFDHTTDFDGGMGPNEWKYITTKVNYYDWLRKGQPVNHVPPIYLAEEFGDQEGMNHVMDIITDGYVGDIRGQGNANKNASFVEERLDRENRFGPRLFILRALETHDEHRLLEGAGFDYWTGAGFYGIGAASRGTPMMLMGQEFGEREGLAFRRSGLLPARFYGHANHTNQGQSLIDFYGKINRARLDWNNRALRSNSHYYLRSKWTGQADPRIFAEVKWDTMSPVNVMFAFHNLWNVGDVENEFYLPPEIGNQLSIQDGARYKLVNVMTGQQAGDCKTGAELKWGLYVHMAASERVQWLRLELCQ